MTPHDDKKKPEKPENLKNLKKALINYKNKHLTRNRWVIQKNISDHVVKINLKINLKSKKCLNFAGNDYLNLSQHPLVKKAFIKGVSDYGFGSGSSPLVSGFYQAQHLLEEKFAEFLNRDKAVLFNSGYQANLGVITALASRKSLVVSDKFSHASIIDGVLLSRAKHCRYRHNNLSQLEYLLAKHCPHPTDLLITESIFSMEGDITPIDRISVLAKKYRANLMVDDAHGIGILGRNGGGAAEHFGLDQKDLPFLIAPLGKAFGGMGAMVSGHTDFINAVIQFSRSYIYSTALPPAAAAAAYASLKIIQTENWRREKLKNLIHFFICQANLRGLNLISSDLTPIKSILIGACKKALLIKNFLLQKGFFVACIRPPSVPLNTARIKICLTSAHEESQIQDLLDLLAENYA